MKALIYFLAYLTLVNAGGRGYLPKGSSTNHGHNSHGGNSFGVVPQSSGIISNAGYGAASFGSSSAHGSVGHSQGLIGSPSAGLGGSSYGSGLSGALSPGFGGYSHDIASHGTSGGSSFGGLSGFTQGIIGSSSSGIGLSTHGSGLSSYGLSSQRSGWNPGYSRASQGSLSGGPTSSLGHLNSGYSGVSHGLSGGSSFGGHSAGLSHGVIRSHSGASHGLGKGSSFGGYTGFSQGVIGSPSLVTALSSYGSGWNGRSSSVSQGLIGGSSHGSSNSGISHGIGSSSYGQRYGYGSSFSPASQTTLSAKSYRPSQILSTVSHGGSSSYPVGIAAAAYGQGHKVGGISSPISSVGPVKFSQGYGGVNSGSTGYQYSGNAAGSSFPHGTSSGNVLSAGRSHHAGSSSHGITNGRYASGSLGGSWASPSTLTGSQSSWGNGSW